jgi:hypothetical protein
MDATEFEGIRWRLKLRHPVTVNKWEKGARPITRIAELAMRGLLCEQECRARRPSAGANET